MLILFYYLLYSNAFVPYLPTSKNINRRILEIAKVKADDVVFDLDTGDRRLLLIVVREFKVKRAIYIELHEALVNEA